MGDSWRRRKIDLKITIVISVCEVESVVICLYNGKQSTVNKSLEGNMYPG